MNPTISIITPTYNRKHTLPRVWESLIKQSEGSFEWIIVDDGSTDGTGDWVSSLHDPRVRYVKQENRGVHVARNRGAEFAKGEYTIFLDSDDEIYDRKTLALMVSDITSCSDDIGLILYRRVDEHTGEPADPNKTDKLVTNFEDHVCDRYDGDYFWIERNTVTMKYPWPHWRNPENDRWWSILREHNAMMRTRPALIYHWDGGDNLSDFSGMLNHTEEVAEAFRELIAKYEEDWIKYCPCQIGKYSFYLAGYEVLSGNWIAPIGPILLALRHGNPRTRVSALVLLFCIPLPRKLCVSLLALRNWNRKRIRRRTG